MPRYLYDCKDCEHRFEVSHSYKYKGTVCEKCNSPNIVKNLSTVTSVRKKTTPTGKQKVGTEVEKAISEGNKELKDMKKFLKGRVHKK